MHAAIIHGVSGAGLLWFWCGAGQYGKRIISVFQEFFASIKEVLVWQGDSALGYHSVGFRHSGVDLQVAT